MNARATPPTASADTGYEQDLIARTLGQPQWHTDGDLLAMAYAADGTLWTVEEPGVLRRWEAGGRQLAGAFRGHFETLWSFVPGGRSPASAMGELSCGAVSG